VIRGGAGEVPRIRAAVLPKILQAADGGAGGAKAK